MPNNTIVHVYVLAFKLWIRERLDICVDNLSYTEVPSM